MKKYRWIQLCSILVVSLSWVTTTWATEPIGNPICDSFITAMDQCLTTKVTEADKADLQTQFDQVVSELKAAALDPAKSSGLPAACDAARNTFKMAVEEYGCSL